MRGVNMTEFYPINFSTMTNFPRFSSFGLNYFNPLQNLPLLQFNNLVLPYLPTFNLPAASSDTPASVDNNSELNPKQKAQIEEIQQMKYDSENLTAKLDENKDINSYNKFFETNSNYHIIRTISSEDGGKIYIYGDKDNKEVGSVNKTADGKVRNVCIKLADGGDLSLNNDDANNSTITNRTAMIYNDIEGDNTSYKDTLSRILNNNPGYSVTTKNVIMEK